MSSISTRRRVLALALPVAAVLCLGNIAQAALIDITVAPPAPRHEDIPAPRAGFTWAPGYWRWDGHTHVWEAGHWEKDRPGHHWVPAAWTSAGGHYHFAEGHWD